MQNAIKSATPDKLRQPSLDEGMDNTTNARVLDPQIAQRLREDHVLVTQDVQHADTKTLATVVRGGEFPVYIIIVRRLPHGLKSAASLAETIRRQLDTTSNALVIVATETDGHLGISASDIEYSTAQEIAERSALVWTQEGYTKGAAQTVRLVEAEREEQRDVRVNRVIWIGVALLFCVIVLGSVWAKRRSQTLTIKGTE